MFGLSFVDAPPVEPAHPARADIALFVGWTTRRAGVALPRGIADWLRERALVAAPGVDPPLPIDGWDTFDALFDWHARPVRAGAAERCDDYLGLAVRDFFANGGRKCYVLRLGDPWPVVPQIAGGRRADALAHLLPGARDALWQREQWRGIEQVWGLEDVSLVLVPDLPDLFGAPRERVRGDAATELAEPEVFVECGVNLVGDEAVPGVRRIAAPRLGDEAFEQWNVTVAALQERLSRRRRDVMLLLAAPLATPDARAARDSARAVTVRGSQLQIATPWFVPTREARTPEGLLPPDGALAGLVAATVLARGAARTAAGRAPLGVLDVSPALPDGTLRTAELRPDDDGALLHRFAVFGPTADGIRLLSDRSASRVDGWRHAGVVRLLGQLLRTARQVGETLVFEPSGEALWTRVRGRFEDLLTCYWEAGALRGATPELAFGVQCDRGTTSQNDLDHGRVVVVIDFVPQLAIERLRVTLALAEDGSVQWTDGAALAEVSP
jgi:hypothetical protein